MKFYVDGEIYNINHHGNDNLLKYDIILNNDYVALKKFPKISTLISTVNNSELFNPAPNQEKIKSELKNYPINSKKNINIYFLDNSIDSNLYENYDPDKKIITLTNSFLDFHKDETQTNEMIKFIFDKMDKQQAVNYVLSHEMAHAVQHQCFLENKTHLFQRENNLQDELINLITATDNYRQNKLFPTEVESDKSKYDINYAISQCVHEGYADLYSCFLTYELSGKNEALKFAQTISDGRKKFNPDYYNSEVMDKFITDLTNNEETLKFSNFKELHQHMSHTISDCALNVIMNKLDGNINIELDKNRQKMYNHAFLGSVPDLLKKLNYETKITNSTECLDVLLKNSSKAKEFLLTHEKIKNKNLNIDSNTEKYCFNQGKELYQNGINFISYTGSQVILLPNHNIKSSLKKGLISDILNGNSNLSEIKKEPDNNSKSINNTPKIKKFGLGL